MKHWTRMMMIGAAGLALTFAACDSDDGNDTDTTTGDTTTTAGDTSNATNTNGGDTTTAPNTCTDPGALAGCNNDADKAIIGDENGTAPSDVAADCGRNVCISHAADRPAFGTCVEGCLNNGDTDKAIVASGLSADCNKCYAFTTCCAAENCLSDCISAATQDACDTCLATNCIPKFEACAGISTE